MGSLSITGCWHRAWVWKEVAAASLRARAAVWAGLQTRASIPDRKHMATRPDTLLLTQPLAESTSTSWVPTA